MSKAQYDIYLSKVMDLAKTVVIKSQATAEAINRSLSEVGVMVNSADPASWKYYLNLNGQYHATDQTMAITSLDTLQTIDFTKDNLQQHRATYREYAFGTRYYNDLVERFPSQEMLIRGVLNPVAINKAVSAEDGEVLYYDPELVEENETNLIPQLNDWCKGFMVRWNVPAYSLTDDLYAASQLAVLYMNVPQVVLNLRLANCHTQYAHTYHIREYLASNGRLDMYVDNLTKKQMLWLYRNIRFLHRNAGKRSTFDLLVKNVLTDRGLPLAEWSMRHNLEDQLEEIYPDVEFARKPLNFGFSSAGADTRSIPEMLERERPMAKSNERVEPDAIPVITELMENSLNNRLSTKILESAVLDLTDASPFTLSDCLLNHWLYLTATENYNAVVVVDNPKSGGKYTFTMQDAFIIFMYTYNKARGLELPSMPVLEAINVRRVPTPTSAELKGIIDPVLVDDALVEQAYENLPTVGTYISTAAFHDAAIAIHDSQLRHRLMYATSEHFVQRGLIEQMVSRLYCDYRCELGVDGENYTDWFIAKGLDIPTFSVLECDLLAMQILSHATGTNLKVAQSLREMQAAMLRLMTQLSSYSIQYLQSINTDPIKVVDWPVIRVGDQDVFSSDELQVAAIDTQVLDVSGKGHREENWGESIWDIGFTADGRPRDLVRVDATVYVQPHLLLRIRDRAEEAPVKVLSFAEPPELLTADEPDSEV